MAVPEAVTGAAGLRVRRLLPGEEPLWFAVRAPRSGVVRPFTREPGFRSDAHLVAELDGVPVGRMESILVEPHEAVLAHPLVADGADFPEVTGALVDAGVGVARGLGVAVIELLLMESLPRVDALRARAPAWGFAPRASKAFFRAAAGDVRWELGGGPAGFVFRAAPAEDDPHLVATLARVFESSFDEDEDAATFLASCVARARGDGVFHPGDWEILESPAGPVGVVLPSFADASGTEGTNFHVGLVPAARGRGLGVMLHLRGLATLRRRGASRFVGSTDVRNAAMRRVFERAGYRRTNVQHVFRLQPRGG